MRFFECIRSLKNPAHHIPNQTEIATEEFCPKSLLRKQNEIDFIESHFQINAVVALWVIRVICFQVSLLSRVTPNSLASLESSSFVPFIDKEPKSGFRL